MIKRTALSLLILSAAPPVTLAHGGRTNAQGCHNERATGGYHCHRTPASRAYDAQVALQQRQLMLQQLNQLQQVGNPPRASGTVYRCQAQGVTRYVSTPIAGASCATISHYSYPATPSPAPTYQARTFHGLPCTQDCSGHEAGYRWAEDNGIESPDDCGGNSRSFIEGCEAWTEDNG